MAKFEVHKYNQAYMARIGIHSYNLTDPTNKFFKSFVVYFNLFMAIAFYLTSSGTFVYLNWPNLEVVVEPTLVIMAGILYGGMLLSVGLNMRKVKLLHLTLQQIVNEVEEDAILKMYWNAEEKCRKYTKLLHYYIPMIQVTFSVPFIASLYNIYVGNLDTSTWELTFKTSVPFSTEPIWGWYILFFIHFLMATSYSICMPATTSYFFSSCFYIDAMCNHFDALIDSLKDDFQPNDGAKGSKSINVTQKMYVKFKVKLRNAVEIHVKSYEVFNLLADINSGAILVLLLPNVIVAACTMFNFEHSSAGSPAMIAYNVCCLIVALTWPFLFCYFATFATHRIIDLSQTVYDSNWLGWPPELRKYFILIMARSQEPVYFNGLGLIYCSLEVFAKLLNASCSYYLIFRNVSQR